ncbi:MAG: UDP-N-acetylglucosamine 2-epimerase [Proteobacteria bacterium]|nr:UDP-N-acetylglucosamine 2-epimerase [Pseudomonadota bacterium]
MSKKILFLTGTRADFGKLKSLINALEREEGFEAHIFVTGMHMFPKYGTTGGEIEKSGFKRIYCFINQKPNDSMDAILANTIYGLSNYLSLLKPDLVVVHGDRVEALAGAIVCALNNILVAHIEGGEISGAIDESIRHAVSKLSHLHFVANNEAKRRLVQMGEAESRIFVIGSPDIDLMSSEKLPKLAEVKDYYEIPFNKYAILIYHPVTTNLHDVFVNIQETLYAVLESGRNYIVIYPNNDTGSDIIIEEYEQLRDNPRFRIFPSIRFEAFLALLRHCEFIIGNSSAGIREAPFYAVPTINIGMRQNGRFACKTILNVNQSKSEILNAIWKVSEIPRVKSDHFGDGKSTERFIDVLKSPKMFDEISIQKKFIDKE